MKHKPILKSKTFWVNILILAGALAAGFADILNTTTAGSLTILTILNLILRTITKHPVTWK